MTQTFIVVNLNNIKIQEKQNNSNNKWRIIKLLTIYSIIINYLLTKIVYFNYFIIK